MNDRFAKLRDGLHINGRHYWCTTAELFENVPQEYDEMPFAYTGRTTALTDEYDDGEWLHECDMYDDQHC